MSVVYIGGAHIDEHGNAYGGQDGNQTGRELSIQRYYTHKLGWRAFRPPSATGKNYAPKIAYACIRACENPHIGYNQYRRGTLYDAASLHGFDPGLVTTDCACDCSSLVRVCCAYAGIRLPDIRTWSEPSALLAAKFTEISPSAANLRPGDILCTPVAGHTEIVCRVDGATSSGEEEIPTMETIRRGSRGYQVQVLQALLRINSYVIDADGICGAQTVAAITDYQRRHGLTADGICGPLTWAQILRGE